jgi:hypothetical protein
VLEMVVHYDGNTPINEYISEEAFDFYLNLTAIQVKFDVTIFILEIMIIFVIFRVRLRTMRRKCSR